MDPISANPEEVLGGGIVFWDPAKSRAIIKPYNPNAQPIPTTSVITTGKEGNPPEIILPPKSNNNN